MNQHYQGCKNQTPAVEIFNKQHGGKHHKMSPVINSAIHTAFIFHNKGLKGAKE
jgi:hypothetical protein